MTTHTTDTAESLAAAITDVAERVYRYAEHWPGYLPGHHRADDAAVFLAQASDEWSAAIAERDDYPDAQVQLDLLHAAQDARRAA